MNAIYTSISEYPISAAGRLRQAVDVLRKHHQWHLSQIEPDAYGIVDADEYQDSAMCQRTLEVLARG